MMIDMLLMVPLLFFAIDASLVLVKKDELSVKAPFSKMLRHYSQYGAIEIHENSINFGRREQHQNAAIWSKTHNHDEDWQFIAKIQLKGEAIGGNGMAFWYTREGHANGPVFGAPDKWHGLGLFVDTYDNDNRGNNPAIIAIMNDGNIEYRQHQDGEGQYFAGCLRNVRNLDHPVTLRVSHIRNILKVEIDDKGDGKDWIVCFEKPNIRLPSGYYFGVSASTSDHPDSMELLDFSISGTKAIDKGEPERELGRSSQDKTAPSSFDSEGLAKLIESSVQRQLASSYRTQEQKLSSIETQLGHTSGIVRNMEKSLNAIGDHLENHHHDAHGNNSHAGLQESLNELKAKMEHLQHEITEYSHGKQSSGINSWALFFGAQLILLITFVVVKYKIDGREKKLL